VCLINSCGPRGCDPILSILEQIRLEMGTQPLFNRELASWKQWECANSSVVIGEDPDLFIERVWDKDQTRARRSASFIVGEGLRGCQRRKTRTIGLECYQSFPTRLSWRRGCSTGVVDLLAD